MKYRKKPIVIEAYQWDGFSFGDVETGSPSWNDAQCPECHFEMKNHGRIKTLEGYHIVCPNDWIITGIKGERYPCKSDIFAATYELAE